jgi:putative phage-type endonuclease
MHPVVQKLIEHHYADQKSEEWLKLRGTMLTASDVATALGENPYEKPSSLILKKCGVPSEFKGNDATRHGERYENIARDLYCERTGEVVHELGLVQHPEISWLGGSADGVTESGKLLEIKCPMSRKIKNEVPKYYIAQLQILMEVLNLEECDFVQYRPPTECESEEYVVVNIKRDREWFAERIPKLQAFWDEVLYKREHGLCEIV